MSVERTTHDELLAELAQLRQRVAELEAVEQERKRLENDLELAFRLSPMLMCLAGLDGYLKRVNRVFQETFGYTHEELLSRPYVEFMHPDDRAAFIAHVNQLAGGVPVFNVETRICRRDGSVRLILWAGIPMTDAGTVLCIGQDITAHKQAEQELAKHRAVLQATLDCLPFNFFAIGADGRYMLQSSVSKTQHGTDVIGKRPEEVCPNKADLALWLDNNRRAFAGEKVEGEVTLAFTGEERFYYNVIAPIKDGEQCYGILGVNIDITERKRAEASLRKAHAELEHRVEERTAELASANEQLALFRKFAEASGQGFSMADLDSHLTYLNPALCQMLGEENPEAAIGRHLSVYYPEEVQRRGELEIQPCVMQCGHWEGELPVLSRRGTIIPTWHNIFLIRDEAGRPLRLAVVITDITEQKKAEQALERDRRTLEHLFRSSDHERQLIAYEIHDGLAQYLAGAIMQFDTFYHVREKMPNEAARAYEAGVTMLRQAHGEARRLISGVRPPILDEAGIVVAISHLIHERRRAGGAKIEFRAAVEFNRLVAIQENAIYRIVQEALTNACKYSQSDRVRVEIIQHGETVRIEVRDWGIGFDPSRTGESCFGLEGIRERTRLLGGTSAIVSSPGEGTKVTVELPLAVREEYE